MHSKCTSVKGSYHFGDPLWPLEISTFFFSSRWVVEYYVQNTGFDFSSNTDSKAGASPLRGVGCIPPDSAQPQNDPLCKFSMQLCRIWFLLKMFLNTFKIWAGSDCSAPMPGTGIGNGCSKPKGQHGPRPWESVRTAGAGRASDEEMMKSRHGPDWPWRAILWHFIPRAHWKVLIRTVKFS